MVVKRVDASRREAGLLRERGDAIVDGLIGLRGFIGERDDDALTSAGESSAVEAGGLACAEKLDESVGGW